MRDGGPYSATRARSTSLYRSDVHTPLIPRSERARNRSPLKRGRIPPTFSHSFAPHSSLLTPHSSFLRSSLLRSSLLIPHSFAPHSFAPHSFAPSLLIPHSQVGRGASDLYSQSICRESIQCSIVATTALMFCSTSVTLNRRKCTPRLSRCNCLSRSSVSRPM